MNQRTFGRRIDPLHRPSGSMQAAAALAQDSPYGSPLCETGRHSPDRHPLLQGRPEISLDEELREWKRARRRNFEIPWRPLSLMASLSFGIATLILPNSVNEIVHWPLYALSAASLYAGFRSRRRQAKS